MARRAGLARCAAAALLCGAVSPAAAQVAAAQVAARADGLPAWVSRAGARSQPTATRVCSANDRGAVGDGETKATAAIQRAIDDCSAAGGGTVTFRPGRYVTGALFVKRDVHLRLDEGVTLLGSQDDADYPSRPTRVAGIEMRWPAALINVDGQRNVKISGRGTMDGRGQKWWDKYWRMRREDYEPRGLRWAVDYDAERVRLMVIANSADVTVESLSLRRSGFWTVQVLYSEHVTVDGVTIGDNGGPSTDGVDIDSSRWVLVQNTDIHNNDDTIVLKAGRDADGLRVNRPTEYVVVRNNLARRGAGVISFGSETSGSIRHVVALDNRSTGTSAGVIFKSAKTRGGVVEDVLIRGLELENVPTAFSFTLDWNPSYSYATLPADTTAIPAHWRTLLTPVPPERGLAEFRDITIEDVRVVGARRIFAATGLPERPIRDVRWRNVVAEGEEAGRIEHARDWTMENVRVRTPAGAGPTIANSVDVDAPAAERLPPQRNPLVRTFLADPSAHVFGDRVYVYLTNDSSNTEKYWDSTNWRLLSSDDLVRWHDHGVVMSLADFAWARQYAWAPAAAERDGTYYLYLPVDRDKIAVASGPSPTGPFRDARGEPLLDRARDADTGAEPIDPMVFVDRDGQAYMYFGSRTPKVVRLATDMVRMEGPIMDVRVEGQPAGTAYGEAPWLHEKDGTYYFSYSTGWPGQIAYATGTSPLGPFTYRGVVLDYTNVSTNHHAIVRRGDEWYLFYHNASLPGGGDYKRSVNVDRLYHEADGSIRRVVPTGGGARPGHGPR